MVRGEAFPSVFLWVRRSALRPCSSTISDGYSRADLRISGGKSGTTGVRFPEGTNVTFLVP
jgi:hypothetical protein